MVKIEKKHACGHIVAHVLPKDYTIKWQSIEWNLPDDCYECQVKKTRDKASKYDMPELTGTEKQIAFANTIRVTLYEYYQNDKIKARISEHTDAKYWIACKIEYARANKKGKR